MSKPTKPSGHVALEDLLKLKRAERPDAEFWSEFERGLRQKQLAAIMEPKPWWLGLSLVARRHGAWAGAGVAVAALALAFSLQSVGVERTELAAARPASVAADAAQLAAAVEPVVVRADAEATMVASASEASAVSPAPASEIAQGIGDLDTITVRAAQVAQEDTERAVARADVAPDVLAGALAQVAMLVDGVAVGGGDTVFAALNPAGIGGVEPAGFGAEPAFAASAPERFFADASGELSAAALNPRQQRLLAGVMEQTGERGLAEKSLAAVRERVLHHVMDSEELYASISRLGVSGDRLQLRF
ncbi:MAG: hypothetical protein MUE42_05035 [Opitutaceae bacterium]|jgi:hypothetical protein|nr:hypothetical protein [Opitutaceae bacterium]